MTIGELEALVQRILEKHPPDTSIKAGIVYGDWEAYTRFENADISAIESVDKVSITLVIRSRKDDGE